MNWIIRKCSRCGRYTLKKDICPYCGSKVYVPHPPRFSPEDKYIRYRIMMKIEGGVLERALDKVSKLFDP